MALGAWKMLQRLCMTCATQLPSNLRLHPDPCVSWLRQVAQRGHTPGTDLVSLDHRPHTCGEVHLYPGHFIPHAFMRSTACGLLGETASSLIVQLLVSGCSSQLNPATYDKVQSVVPDAALARLSMAAAFDIYPGFQCHLHLARSSYARS